MWVLLKDFIGELTRIEKEVARLDSMALNA